VARFINFSLLNTNWTVLKTNGIGSRMLGGVTAPPAPGREMANTIKAKRAVRRNAPSDFEKRPDITTVEFHDSSVVELTEIVCFSSTIF
jgi:hypothetical protein